MKISLDKATGGGGYTINKKKNKTPESYRVGQVT